jgi:hypothetical protein
MSFGMSLASPRGYRPSAFQVLGSTSQTGRACAIHISDTGRSNDKAWRQNRATLRRGPVLPRRQAPYSWHAQPAGPAPQVAAQQGEVARGRSWRP